MNLLKIDLTKYNQDKLSQIEKEHSINEGYLLSLKKDEIIYVWLNKDEDNPYLYHKTAIVAFTHKSDRNKITYMLDEYLTNYEEYIPKKRTKNYNIDNILEKINTNGIESISKSENDYLIQYSKNL